MAKAKETEVKPGTKINLVLASGKLAPAKVTKVLTGGKVNLEADLGGDEPLVITGSPLDDTGKLPDSWHLAETAEVAQA